MYENSQSRLQIIVTRMGAGGDEGKIEWKLSEIISCVFMCAFHLEITSFFGKSFLFFFPIIVLALLQYFFFPRRLFRVFILYFYSCFIIFLPLSFFVLHGYLFNYFIFLLFLVSIQHCN
jgi:hypothetical protein